MKFAQEDFMETLPEIREIMGLHWQEVTSDPDLPLSLDMAQYAAMHSQGVLALFTARVDGRLVGYILHVVWTPPHYAGLKSAQDDAHFMLPEHRHGRNVLRFFQFAEEGMAAMGVKVLAYHSKARPDLHQGRFFEHMGYRPREVIYSKRLGG